jgi:hypothetical protein
MPGTPFGIDLCFRYERLLLEASGSALIVPHKEARRAGTALAGAVRHRILCTINFRPGGPTQYDNDSCVGPPGLLDII